MHLEAVALNELNQTLKIKYFIACFVCEMPQGTRWRVDGKLEPLKWEDDKSWETGRDGREMGF